MTACTNINSRSEIIITQWKINSEKQFSNMYSRLECKR
uniref:Uncharacterized protein n=1 Tax=Arundo donax TaxID=35708 RepID=A0A0A9DQP4_ARUDO